jgi:lipoyl(octanoyl) transferase
VNPQLLVRHLGLRPYLPVWNAMREFTHERTSDSPSELWLLEHTPVFTQGQAGRAEHLLDPGDIPVIQSDRGGQITYHGPGQLIAYLLLDLKVLGLGVKALVKELELVIIELLQRLKIEASTRPSAPGVYVDEAKIASIGLRICRGCCYHGISFNVAPDLSPFQRINPCGYPGLAVTSLKQLGNNTPMVDIENQLVSTLSRRLGYTGVMASDKAANHE